MRRLLLVLGLAFATVLFAQRGDRKGEVQAPVPSHIVVPPAPILSPEEALATLKVAPGYRVELVAADPLIHDPVAITFGPDGRLWVAEMRGYMPNADGVGEDAQVGTIAVLEDTNRDGRMDQRTVYAEGLVMPRALALVNNGLLVAEPPYLWFLEDTNGDGKADKKTEVASDYGKPGNPEHTANGLLRGLDNWIYSAKHTTRFRYEGAGKFIREPTVTRGQWGISQDNFGRLYHNTNSDPLHADLVPAEYFRRNPNLTAPAGVNVRLVPANLRIWPGRVTPGVNRGYQILNDEGKISAMTAACGPLIYRGNLFPPDFAGNAFVPEPSANLVKRILLTNRDDGTVVGQNAYSDDEFLTSTDERFRPVNLTEGPDGAIYVVDMYRGILQHRIFLTSFLRQQIEERGLDKGIGLGRIYRIVPENARPPRVPFDLSLEPSDRLIARLNAANSWWRDTAQRLLVERRDPASIAPLRAVARSANAWPLARLHALWTLEGMGSLDFETVLAAMDSSDPGLRTAGIRLSENFLSGENETAVLAHLYRFANKEPGKVHPHVIVQTAFSLGSSSSPEALQTLANAARLHGDTPHVADAIVSGLNGRELDFINLVAADAQAERAAKVVVLATSSLLKSRDAKRIADLMAQLEPGAPVAPWVQEALLDGIEYFLPKAPRGRLMPGALPIEPKAVLALAALEGTTVHRQAAKLAPLLRWPGMNAGADGAEASRSRLTPEQRELFEKGRTQYAAICAACHQPEGEGMNGLAPQLVYSNHVLGPERNLARIILSGKEGNGMMMPPLNSLDDEAIASVLTYMRQSWGHNAPPVAPSLVKEMREEAASRTQPWTDEELQALTD